LKGVAQKSTGKEDLKFTCTPPMTIGVAKNVTHIYSDAKNYPNKYCCKKKPIKNPLVPKTLHLTEI